MLLDEIRDWLTGLSQHVPKTHEVADLAVVIERTATMLAAKAPPDLFTPDSLEFCLRRFRFFPSYAELWARLQTYERERGKQPSLAPPAAPLPDADPDMGAVERAMIHSWGGYRSGAKPLGRGVTLRTALDVMRQHKPDAFAYVVKTDDVAREIAEKQGWIREPEPVADAQATQQVSIATSVALAELSKGASAPAVSSDAPEPLAHPAPSPGGPAHTPGSVRPEQLRAIRMANPLLRPIAERDAIAEVKAKLAAQHPAMRPYADAGAFRAPWHDDP